MSPTDVIKQCFDPFNRGDADGIAEFYAEDPITINHHVAEAPLEGNVAIEEIFAREVRVMPAPLLIAIYSCKCC